MFGPVFGDRERPARVAAEQDRAVRRYVRYELYPYSAFYRAHLDRSLNGPGVVRSRAATAAVPLVSPAALTDPMAVVLTPDPESVSRDRKSVV